AGVGVSGGLGRDWQPVAVDDCVRTYCWYPRTGGDDACQVERVGGRDPDDLAGAGRTAHRPQLLDRLGKGVLLTAEAGDEAPASRRPPRFHAAQGPLDLPPRKGQLLAGQEVAEHDSPPGQQLL